MIKCQINLTTLAESASAHGLCSIETGKYAPQDGFANVIVEQCEVFQQRHCVIILFHAVGANKMSLLRFSESTQTDFIILGRKCGGAVMGHAQIASIIAGKIFLTRLNRLILTSLQSGQSQTVTNAGLKLIE